MIITVEINGRGEIRCLDTELLPLDDLGETIRFRATHVEYDNDKKDWYVKSATTGQIVARGFTKRSIALKWEEENFSPNGPYWEEVDYARSQTSDFLETRV